MRLTSRISTIILLGAYLSSSAYSNVPVKPIRIDTAPKIDGNLNDLIWQSAPYVTGFRTFIPDFGKVMPESTVVHMAYDNDNLYFAFRCFDPDPKTIKAEITSRDNIRSNDWICINLDSFNDQQSLYGLYVNPLGIQMDSRYAAGNEDYGVDLIWYSAGKIYKDGYSIEVQIPLKSIRYVNKNPVDMGVIFERRVSRRSEQGTYPPLDPKKGFQFTTQTMTLLYDEVNYHRLFEILPAVTYGLKHRDEQGVLKQYEQKGEVSFTTKFGITSDLILDATYNPDFSQVEADAGQVDVNLRYGLFFAEKRPFFLEGRENFNLAASGGSLQTLVHTRTIVNPILGIKLSGKITPRNTISSIYAVDELLDASSSLSGEKAVFPIFRYKYSLSDDSYVGALYAGREIEGNYNRVGGTDGYLRIGTAGVVEYHALYSHTKKAEQSPPLEGHSVSAQYKYGTRDLDFNLSANKISADFSADAGYLTRSGIYSLGGSVKPKFYPSSSFFRRTDVEGSSFHTHDEFSKLWEMFNEISVNQILTGGLSFRIRYSYATEVYLGKLFDTGGFMISGGGLFTKQLNLNLSYRKTNAIYFSASPFQGKASRATANLTYQPWTQLEANVSFTYVGFFRESDGARIYEYPITRLRLTYQFNKYLFFRGIGEYNKFRRTLLSDFLASFTYVPGTVFHVGYGSLYQQTKWEQGRYVNADEFLETKRGFFAKMSYLWRL